MLRGQYSVEVRSLYLIRVFWAVDKHLVKLCPLKINLDSSKMPENKNNKQLFAPENSTWTPPPPQKKSPNQRQQLGL